MDHEELKNLHTKCDIQMYGQVTVGSKGQVVIPKEIRKKLHINAGDTLVVVTKHGTAIGLVKMDDMAKLMEYFQEEMKRTM